MTSPANYFLIGATGGIGTATCRLLREKGARLAVGARTRESVETLATELDAVPIVVDARDSAATDAALGKAVDELGRLDGVACLAGSILLKPAHITTDEDWTDTLEQNLGTAFRVLRASAKRMRSGGSIVLMSSAAASTGLSNHEAIAAAKAGVEGLTRAAAASYAGRGLRVNAVAPGLVRTPLSEALTANPKALAASEAMHPLGRIGEAEEVARAIAWLLDPEQSWITGQVLGVDGGLARLRPRA